MPHHRDRQLWRYGLEEKPRVEGDTGASQDLGRRIVASPEESQDDVGAVRVVVVETECFFLGPQQRLACRFGAVLECPHQQ
jgi:hypothetical protein